MKQLSPSELILNPDGSIYHLAIKPEDLAPVVITVGDPDRVAKVSSYFDTIDIKKSSREFVTHTGSYKGHRITVLSTGIGPDNIDIVFNELDALVNIDFGTRTVKKELTSLKIVRLGTSGSIDASVPLDCFLISELAIGFDQTIPFYLKDQIDVSTDFNAQTGINLTPYLAFADQNLLEWFNNDQFLRGFTATFVGFYGPQGRALRITSNYPNLIDQLAHFEYQQRKVTNLEMETSAIYAFSKLMGHQALSINCILADRHKGLFSERAQERIDEMIQLSLSIIASNL